MEIAYSEVASIDEEGVSVDAALYIEVHSDVINDIDQTVINKLPGYRLPLTDFAVPSVFEQYTGLDGQTEDYHQAVGHSGRELDQDDTDKIRALI